MTVKDTALMQGMRQKLVMLLRSKGINDENVLNSIAKVPRHAFMDLSLERIAYEDRAIEQLLEIKNRDKVLEIGTGSGYQTAVLYNISSRIYTIERQKLLFDAAIKNFEKLNIHPQCFYGDGYNGLPGFAPFHKILVTCGAPYIPEKLVQQLRIGGMMVIPVGDDLHTMVRITKISENQLKKETFGDFKFVPMLSNVQ